MTTPQRGLRGSQATYFGDLTTPPMPLTSRISSDTTPSNGELVSACTFRHHAVTLRVFARWLHDEGYTQEHRLERLKTPKVPQTIVEVLTPDEIKRLLAAETPNTFYGSRNYAMLMLALDTGLRISEIKRASRSAASTWIVDCLPRWARAARNEWYRSGRLRPGARVLHTSLSTGAGPAPVRLRIPSRGRLAARQGRDADAGQAASGASRQRSLPLAPPPAHVL